MVVMFLQVPSRASHSPNGCDVWLEVAPVRMTVGTRFHWVISSAPATGTNTGTPVSRLTWATAGPSWPHSGQTRKCTFSLCTRRRAWLRALSGLQAVSATMMRTGRPATLLPCCSQNSSCPRTVSWPDLASAPVSGARNPMRISSCALARDTTVVARAKTTAAVSRLMASSSGARSEVAHIYHDRAPGGKARRHPVPRVLEDRRRLCYNPGGEDATMTRTALLVVDMLTDFFIAKPGLPVPVRMAPLRANTQRACRQARAKA